MKKIFLGLFAVLLLSGCTKQNSEQTQAPTTGPGSEMADSQNADFVTSDEYAAIYQALASGEAVSCNFTDDNNALYTYYLKGEKFKIFNAPMDVADGVDLPESVNMLSDGSYVYTWDDNSKTGTKYEVAQFDDDQSDESEGFADEIPDNSQIENLREAYDQGHRIDCMPSDISDSEFVAPSDVTFTDISDMTSGFVLPEDLGEFEE